jgi:hypothetical protein
MNRNSNRCIRLPGNKSPIPMKTFSSLKKQKRSNTPEMHQKQVKSAQPWVCTRRNRNQSKLLFNLEQSVFIHSKTNPRSSIYSTHQVAIHTRKRNVYVEPIALLTASGQTVLASSTAKKIFQPRVFKMALSALRLITIGCLILGVALFV